MTKQISILRNLKCYAAISTFALSVNFASCQLSRFAWFLTREAFNLLCSAALMVWHSSEPQVFAAHQLLGCPVATLHLIQSALHAVADAL